MSRNASTARTSSISRRLGALAVVAAAAAALPLADAAVASAATPAPSSVQASSTTATHAFSLSTHTLAYGNRNLGSASTKQVVLKNTGTAALHPVQVLSGASSFSLSANTCASAKVAPGASCTYTVKFAPKTAGAAAASMTVLTLEGTPAQKVAISGNGVQQLMEHYFYQYTYANPPVINGVAAPQSFIGEGWAKTGTYTAGQTIAVFDTTGLRQLGSYRIGNVDNTVALSSTKLDTVNVSEYDWGTNRYVQGTGLVSQTGTAGLGSEAGSIAGLGAEGSGASFNDQHPAVVPMHW